VDGQRVLALTFMHGSRFRLMDRLAMSSARPRYECSTFDRFAWELCRRWRSRLRAAGIVLANDDDAPNYDATCAAAGILLKADDVVKWITLRYPVVVIDEFQDCAPARLGIAQRLHGHTEMLIAADDFQNLNMTTESPAVVWLRDIGVAEELTVVHRTNVSELLSAALALRQGTALADGTSFRLVSMFAKGMAASFVSQTIGGYAANDVVILSAARIETSAWVQKICELVAQKQYGEQKAGPFLLHWEKTAEALADGALTSLGLSQTGTTPVQASHFSALGRGPVFTRLARWIEHQRRVLGRTSFTADEIRRQVSRGAQHVRSIETHAKKRGHAMTIHQAKNREFPIVVVLWPFAVPGDPAIARRWLYNAVTRAKKRVIVLVEDPKKTRLTAAPFV
jgi:hypothetical protein